MPNWCENKLIVKGTTEELADFVRKHTKKIVRNNEEYYNIDFETIIPSPKTKDECPKRFLNVGTAYDNAVRGAEVNAKCYNKAPDYSMCWFNWYEWNVYNWGTKWNADTVDCPSPEDIIRDKADKIVIYYSTAWSPATPVVYKLKEMYPNLDIKSYYFEPGMLFGGYINNNGDLKEYSDTLESFKFYVRQGFLTEEEVEEFFDVKL